MSFRKFALGAAASALFAPAAFAQQPAAPAAPAPVGPPLPGVCVFSQDVAVGASVVGKYVGQRLQAINTQTNAELNAQRASLENEAKALDGQRATLGEQAYQTQANALNQKAAQFQQLVEVRQRESELTTDKALQQIGANMKPIIEEVVRARNCSLLIDRNAVLFVGQASMDLTPEVVQKLDAKITQFPIERETLPPGGQAAAAPAAAPAAAAARPAQGPTLPAGRGR